MFGAIPAEWWLAELADQGVMTQMELDLPRHYIIDEEFLSSCVVAFYHLNGKGQKTGSHSTVDHPAFAALRDHLEATGQIKTQRQWWNGDRVLKSFYLNGVFFDVGDQFPSASALATRININNEHRKEARAL